MVLMRNSGKKYIDHYLLAYSKYSINVSYNWKNKLIKNTHQKSQSLLNWQVAY